MLKKAGLLFISFLAVIVCDYHRAEASCWRECANLTNVGHEIYGDEYCCRHGDNGAEIKEGPCHPELDPGGFLCWSWKARYLEEAGCMTGPEPEDVGQDCFDHSIAVAAKDLIECSFEPNTCTYGDEYMDSTPETICWECPSDGPGGG